MPLVRPRWHDSVVEHRARVPGPLDAAREKRLADFVSPCANSRKWATNVARYGSVLALRYDVAGPPRKAKDLDEIAEGRLATDMLGRTQWDPNALDLTCAARAMRGQPETLLATPLHARRSRSPDSHIYGMSALYRDAEAVPTGLERTHSDSDRRHEEAVFSLASKTVKVASNCACLAPIVCCDLNLADSLIDRLMRDMHPFAALIDPIWWHRDLECRYCGFDLLGNTPYELFDTPGDHIMSRRLDQARVDVVPMQIRDRPGGSLFFARVRGRVDFDFLARAPKSAPHGVEREATRAAVLALKAATLRHDTPLAELGLEDFNASESRGERWKKHMTIVQALLTFARFDRLAYPTAA